MADFKQSNNSYIVSIGNDEIDKIDIVQLGGRTMKQWYDKQTDKPDYMINASLWDDKGAIGTIWQNGELVRNEGNGYGFGINKSGYFHFGNPWDTAWNNYITGYPALIKDGKIMPDSVDSYVMNSHTKRSVIGSAGDKLYLISMNNVTIEQLKVALSNFGIYNAINLDGGGSSRLMIVDKAVNAPTADRIIPNAIAVWLKKDNKQEDNNTMATKKVFCGVGHGGKDPGAVANGKEEADINLSIALACRDELVHNGVEVKMSRISDEDDPLTEEIAECNAYNPDLAIDIHTNAGGGDGFEVYHTIYGGTGKTLAENIEAEVIKSGQNSRGVKTRENSSGKDYYGFIRQTSCPAVICEIGFIDNKNDLKDFDEQAEQIKFGKAYAHGILKTLGVEIMTDTQTPVKDETKHWAYKHYESLIANGVDLEETDFDGNITRGEAFALADKIIKALKA